MRGTSLSRRGRAPGTLKPGTVVLVGAGRMGGALLRGWVANGIGPLAIVENNPSDVLRKLAKAHDLPIFESAAALPPGKAKACVIALKPQVLATEAGGLKPLAQSGALMLSIAAGTSLKNFAKAWGAKARVIRAMPNTPGAIGKGISALYAPSSCKAVDRKLAQTLLAPLGKVLWVGKETLIDSVTAVSGSGPAYVFLMVDALAAAARDVGLPDEVADILARQTIIGAGALLDAEKASPADLRIAVTSPKGTTQAALDILMDDDALKRLVIRAVRAARDRAKELAA